MAPKFELFAKKKMNNIYLTEIMRTYWIQMLDEYWDEKETPYSDDYYFCTNWLYEYFNKLLLGELIESPYLAWKPEQHRLKPKYEIMH